MRRLRNWPIHALLLSLTVVAAVLLFHADSKANREETAALPQPVVNTHVLMERFHEVYHKALRAGMQTEPADRAGWKVIEHNAVRIAEASNLVAIRKVKETKRAKWMKLTAMNQQAAMQLYAAARAKKFADAGKAYGAVIETCNACHVQMDPDEAPVLER